MEQECILLDDTKQELQILIGTKCTISYKDIEKVSVLNEDANFKGKTEPFLHQVLGGVSFFTFFGGPGLYVGLKILLKDGSIKAAYISDRKTGMNTDWYREDVKKAKLLKRKIDKRIECATV